MGRLVPGDIVLNELNNDEEREVVEAFVESLSDGWFVLPSVRISDWRDYELDIVLVHANYGVAVVEVKGHTPVIREGRFYSNGALMNPQPDEQASKNSHQLATRIRAVVDDQHFSVAYAVAFPNVAVRSRVLPTSLRREQFLTKAELDDPTEAIEALFRTKHQAGPGPVATAAIMQLLAPDIDLTPDPEMRGRYARKQLARISANHVRALESLDINRRVFVDRKSTRLNSSHT